MRNWKAQWVWYPGMQRKPNFYFYLRKQFNLAEVKAGVLHISAYSDYRVWINGHEIGRGPNPSAPHHTFYDSYDVTSALIADENVVAVLAHNYAVGLHWHPMGPGGFIAELEFAAGDDTRCIGTDTTWRVHPADCYDLKSPRMMWTCQFTETFRAKEYDPEWVTLDYDDAAWSEPEVLGQPPLHPWEQLISREIPFLRETEIVPVSAQRGTFTVSGFHAVSFAAIQQPQTGLYCATTYLYSDAAQQLTMAISSDDAFKVFLNGDAIHEQSYLEWWVREQMWVGREDFEQTHNGAGPRWEYASFPMRPGWNELAVVIDLCAEGWGFSLGIIDGDIAIDHTATGHSTVLNQTGFMTMPFGSAPDTIDHQWLLRGPFPSSAMKNSLEGVLSDELPSGGRQIEHDSRNVQVITDYDLLIRSERRTIPDTVEITTPLTMEPGEYIIFDLGNVYFGFITIKVETNSPAILDIGWGNVISSHHSLSYMYQIRCADRIILDVGRLTWKCAATHELRYIHISCRQGERVVLHGIGIQWLHYPIAEVGSFDCADELLNRVYRASVHNNHLLMQDSYFDSMRREQGVQNARSLVHGFMGMLHSFGDTLLTKKTIRDVLRTQDESGWFCGHGYNENSWDEPTKMMWTYELVSTYFQYTGDIDFIKEIYSRLQNGARYFSRLENKQLLIDSRNEYRDLRGRAIYLDDYLLYPPYIRQFDMVLLGYNAMYAGSVLNGMALLAEALGKVEDATFYRLKQARVGQSCREVFWDVQQRTFSDWIRDEERSTGSPEVVLIMALYYRICDDDQRHKLLDDLFGATVPFSDRLEAYHFTFGFYHYILTLLFENSKDDLAYKVLREYYGGWLALGMTTMGEHFSLSEVRGKAKLGREYNVHGYGTSAHPHFFSNILGLTPIAPGFTALRIVPHPGDLAWAKGSAYTSQGPVHISWNQSMGKFTLDVRFPEHCVADVEFPLGFEHGTITINGNIVAQR